MLVVVVMMVGGDGHLLSKLSGRRQHECLGVLGAGVDGLEDTNAEDGGLTGTCRLDDDDDDDDDSDDDDAIMRMD